METIDQAEDVFQDMYALLGESNAAVWTTAHNLNHDTLDQIQVYGLDLGGPPNDAAEYLPAHQRYSGRLHTKITDEAWENYFENTGKVKVLIMSGLYGLVEPNEYIQNYDVHLTDTHKVDGLNVRSQWWELYTNALTSYVRNAATGKRRVKIYNFLCDHHYVEAIRWLSLPKDLCSVYHFASRSLSDTNLLPPAGILIDAILKDPELLESFDRDNADQYELTRYGLPPNDLSDFKFGFDSRVSLSNTASSTGSK